ncbi:MAG TPA: DUF1684 domain-containing protein [Micromonosporaceae bacterium]|nr:DUF1684 domain-containing protein [Micromonosporaceae bacterium]
MELLELADYRASVARMHLADTDIAGFRAARDALFATHPQSPVPADDRPSFAGLDYYPPTASFVVEVAPEPAEGTVTVDTGGPDGVVTYRRVARLVTGWGSLTLFWIDAYGGGLFLPFRDGTSGPDTYGGGRYLTDTVKGTFGRGVQLVDDGLLRLDLNYAYNPSCAYDPRWACPLAPDENWLTAPVTAGERNYEPSKKMNGSVVR